MGWSARSEAGSAGVCAASAFGSLFWKGGLCRGWGSCSAGGLTHRQSFVDGLIALRCGLRRGAGAGPPCAGAGGRRGPERSLTFRILRCPRSGRGGGLPSWPGLAAGGRSVFRVGGFPFAFVLVVCLGVCLVGFLVPGLPKLVPCVGACRGVLWGSPCHQWGVVRISTTCELPVGVLSDPVSALASEAA